ncbi:hypothetical protein [Pantoea sp. B65]
MESIHIHPAISLLLNIDSRQRLIAMMVGYHHRATIRCGINAAAAAPSA